MGTEVDCCPVCRENRRVLCLGKTRQGVARCRCVRCHKTFLASHATAALDAPRKAAIELALTEGVAWHRIRQTLGVSWLTIFRVARLAHSR